jgi:hypothetical protein
MSGISLIADTESGVTELSNIFIEHYMSDANEVQLKLYIYLLKLRSTGSSVEFSDIVDFLDFSERDVMRALHYWEEKHLIYVGYRKDALGEDDVHKPGRKSSRAYAKKAESITSIRFADPAELLYRMDADSERLMSVEEEEPADVPETEEQDCYSDEDIASDAQPAGHRSRSWFVADAALPRTKILVCGRRRLATGQDPGPWQTPSLPQVQILACGRPSPCHKPPVTCALGG